MDSKEKKQQTKPRRNPERQTQNTEKTGKEQEKQNKKASSKSKRPTESKSKIKDAVNKLRAKQRAERSEKLSREEKFRREGKKKIRNLRPKDHEEGYYIDEYSEKKRQEKRAKQIRKQENEVIRRNKKPLTSKQIRKKRIIISASIFAAVLVIGVILSLTVLFKTEYIKVEGDSYYDEGQITAFSNVAPGQNIFIGTWNSTPEEIVKNLSYIESANVSFSIPDTVVITVQNAEPAYAIKDGSGYLIVSSKGRILDTSDTKPNGLIELKCGDFKNKAKGEYIDFGDDSVSEILHSVKKSFEENGVDKIMGFDITNLSGIIINYDNRIDINIGLPEDIDYKIKTAFTIIDEKLDPNKTGTVAGTLDVSTCNKNKMSRYKPAPAPTTTAPPPTQPVTVIPTEPTRSPEDDAGDNADNGDNGGNEDNYDYGGDYGDGYDYGLYGYDGNDGFDPYSGYGEYDYYWQAYE